MKKDFKYIGENVRKIRKSKNLTLEQLAELVGISESFLGVAERGASGFSTETIIKISDALNVTTDSLLKRGENTTIAPSDRMDTLTTMLKNATDEELDFLIDYVKLCKGRVQIRAKEKPLLLPRS